MSYTADSIRIRIVTPDSIRIRFERKRTIRRSLIFLQNIMHGEKYPDIHYAEWWISVKRCRIWDPVGSPPNLTPGYNNNNN